MNALPIDDTTTANGIAPAPTESRLAGRVRRGLVVAALATLTSVSLAGTASAASPGAYNMAVCDPNTGTITQTIEAYRSYSTEYIQLQGALVNSGTGATRYSPWFLGTGPVSAQVSITYYSVARGSYNVWYRWASWNPTQNRYIFSSWYQPVQAQLSTLGRWDPSYGSNGAYRGGATGVCYI